MSAGDAAQRVKRQVQDGVAKAQREFEAAKDEAKRVNARSQTPPAANADEAAQQVRDIRARLDRDVASLEARIPPAESMLGQARALGGAVVGGVGLIGVAATLRQKRQEKKAAEAEADHFARAIARHLPAAVAQLSPPISPRVVEDDHDDGGGGGKGRTLVIVALLAGAAFAVWKQLGSTTEPDIWGPAPDEPPVPPTGAPGDPTVPATPPTPPSAPGVSSTAPTANDDDLFGNRPPAP